VRTTLPANLDAERAVLGGILLDNHAYIEAAESLAPEDFSILSHRRVYRRMVEMFERAKPCDPVTIADELTAEEKELERCGGGILECSLRRSQQSRKRCSRADAPLPSSSALTALPGLTPRNLVSRKTGSSA